MRRLIVPLAVSSILLCLWLGIAQPQSIIGQQQELQQQVDELRRDVANLQSTVGGLRRIILRQGIAAQKFTEKTAPQGEQRLPDAGPEEDGRIKAQICRAVGQFFEQIDRAVKMSDGEAANEVMKKALAQLNSELDRYSTYGQVRHILSVAEGLALDTYDAVVARSGIVGNADFIRFIENYRKKYKTVCPAP